MAQISALQERVRELEGERQKLYEEANLGSDTSGIPSSKDWKRGGCAKEASAEQDGPQGIQTGKDRETPTSISSYLKKEGGKRPGGQKGHAPSSINAADVQQRPAIAHYPAKCASCPNNRQCVEDGMLRKCYTAHEYDIEVVKVHRERHVYEVVECAFDGSRVRGDLPQVVIGAQYYGMNVQLHVITWHHLLHGSYGRIAQVAKEMFGLSLGAGTTNAIMRRVSEKIVGSGFFDALRFYVLLFEKVIGLDETSASAAGRTAWVHTVATDNATFLSAHWRRGFDGATYHGVAQYYAGKVISDCWAAYFNDGFYFENATCDGHILRELVAAAYFRHQHWAICLFDLLIEVYTAKEAAIESGETGLPQAYIDAVRARYRQVISDGFDKNAGVTKGKTYSLLVRLRRLENSVLAFAEDFNVSFTNNISEQSLRDLKVASRVAGQFKTMAGLGDYCIVQSFMDTCRKQGHNPFDMMRTVLTGGDVIEAVFGAEKAQLKQMVALIDIAPANRLPEIGPQLSEALPDGLTMQLNAALDYGHYKAFNGPPPERKKTDCVKDKMKAARHLYELLQHSRENKSAPFSSA